jgi:hypothetical protein
MHVRKLFAAVAASLCLALGALAQTDPGAATPSPGPAKEDSKKSTRKKGSKKTSRSSKTSKKSSKKSARKGKTSAPSTTVQTIPADPLGPPDDEAPQLSHQPAAGATRGKAMTVAAHATDASGVFGPILYVRKKGLGAGDYIPIKMIASKIVPGDYAVDVPAGLTNVDGLEYYIEAWDHAGNGPTRAGSAEVPFAVMLEEEKKAVATPTAPTNVTIRPKGVPPAITHAALTQALKGKPLELNARLVGESGVHGAAVMFRRSGEKDYKALPMGNIGGDDYTATIPASMTTSDLEYYVEAFDQYGNGPARSGAPNVPYAVRVTEPGPPPVAPPSQASLGAHKRALDEDPEPRNTIFGIGIDGGAPGGAGFTLLVRPLWWLRLNGGVAYNVAGLGYRGGITLSPGDWAVTPTLNIDAGRYLSGDYNKVVTTTDPNVRSLLSKTTYTFATAQVGLEFGSQRRFAFYVRGGLTYLISTLPGAEVTAIAQGNTGDPNNTFRLADTKFSALVPCASLGFNIFIY